MTKATQPLHRPKTLWCFLTMALGCCLLYSCYKDSEMITTIIRPGDPVVIISADQVLSVLDELHSPLPGAELVFDGQSIETDDRPYYHFHGSEIDKRHSVLDYFHPDLGHIPFALYSIENDITYTDIQVVKQADRNRFPSSSPRTVAIEGGELQLETEAFLENGSTFHGDIVFKSLSREIQSASDLALVPGGPVGVGPNGNFGFLDVHRLLAIFPCDEDGNALAFTDNRAQLHVSVISPTQRLYHLSVDGVWTAAPNQEVSAGILSLQSPKAGFYILANWSEYILASGQVRADGLALPKAELSWSWNGKPIKTCYTSNSGKWEVYLPADSDLSLEISTACEKVKNQAFRTSFENAEALVIDVSDESVVSKISGTTRNCADAILDGHFLTMTSEGNSVTLYMPAGIFSTAIAGCYSELSLQSITSDWSQRGPVVTWPLSPEIQVQTTYACNALQGEYLTIRINGDQKIYHDASSEITGDQRLLLSGSEAGMPPDQGCHIWVRDPQTGRLEDMQLNISFEDMDQTFSLGGYFLNCPTSPQGCGFETFEITHFGETGEWIRGYFEGTFWVKTFDPLTAGNRYMTGEFQVIRDF